MPYCCWLKLFFIKRPSKFMAINHLRWMWVSGFHSLWYDLDTWDQQAINAQDIFWGIWVSTWGIGSDLSHLGPELSLRSPVKVVKIVFWVLNLIFYILPLHLSSQLDIRVLMLKLLVDSLMVGRKGQTHIPAEFLTLHLHKHFPSIKTFHNPVSVHCSNSPME